MSKLKQTTICHYCQRKVMKGGGYTVDHVIPISKGGTNDPINRVHCCADCNGFKANYNLEQWYQVVDILLRYQATIPKFETTTLGLIRKTLKAMLINRQRIEKFQKPKS